MTDAFQAHAEQSVGEQEQERAFEAWWHEEIKRRYPFYTDETRHTIFISRREEDKRVWQAGVQYGQELRGCCRPIPTITEQKPRSFEDG